MEQEYRFCPRCATALTPQTHFGQVRPACPACGWVYYADPKVAVAAIVERDGKLLLTRRIYEPQRGCWTLPAGFVDAHEDPAEAVVRECLEETGLQVRVDRLIDLLSGREHPRGSDILLVYRVDMIGGELRPGDDADRADFFDLEKLPNLAFKSTITIINKIKGC